MEKIGITALIVYFVILIVFFLLIREVILWYYKINRRVELQEETVRLLRRLVEQNTAPDNTNYSKELGDESSVNNPEVMRKIISDLDKK